jgi:hypothetical protein
VETARGAGQVTGIDVLRRAVSVRFDDAVEQAVQLGEITGEE